MLQKSRQFYKIICKTTIHTLHLIIHDKKEERKKYTYIQVFEADIKWCPRAQKKCNRIMYYELWYGQHIICVCPYINTNVAQIQGCHTIFTCLIYLRASPRARSPYYGGQVNTAQQSKSARRINLFIHDEWVSILPNIWNLFTLLLYMLHDQTMLWKKSRRFYIEWSKL